MTTLNTTSNITKKLAAVMATLPPGVEAKATYTHGDSFAAVVWETSPGRCLAAFVGGKARKPRRVFSCPFDFEYVDGRIKQLMGEYAQTAKKHTLEPGDILRYSWGLEQTNIQWFQVVARTATKVTLREVEGIVNNHHDEGGSFAMRGETAPLTGFFKGDEFTKAADGENTVKMDYGRAYPAEFVEVAGVKCYTPVAFSCYS